MAINEKIIHKNFDGCKTKLGNLLKESRTMNKPKLKSDLQIKTERYKNDLFIRGCYDQLRIIHEQSPMNLIAKDKKLVRVFKDDEQSAMNMIYKCMNDYCSLVYKGVYTDCSTAPDK